jgi:hypothetical protein
MDELATLLRRAGTNSTITAYPAVCKKTFGRIHEDNFTGGQGK